MAESKFMFSGKLGRSGWRGERVMAFEEMPRSPWERNLMLREAPVMMASGSFKSLLIQDREDRRKAQRAGTEALETRSRSSMLDAEEWAVRAGFTPEQQSFAAITALMLRSSRGPGNVTRQMVFQRCQAQHPHLFGELTREQAV